MDELQQEERLNGREALTGRGFCREAALQTQAGRAICRRRKAEEHAAEAAAQAAGRWHLEKLNRELAACQEARCREEPRGKAVYSCSRSRKPVYGYYRGVRK